MTRLICAWIFLFPVFIYCSCILFIEWLINESEYETDKSKYILIWFRK